MQPQREFNRSLLRSRRASQRIRTSGPSSSGLADFPWRTIGGWLTATAAATKPLASSGLTQIAQDCLEVLGIGEQTDDVDMITPLQVEPAARKPC